MARVNKPKNNNKKRTNKPINKETKKANVIVQEESPKGEAFFKVVLWLMLAAFLVAATWLTVQTIINNKPKDDFASEMYITNSDLNTIATEEAYKSSDNLSKNLKKAFTKKLDVYIYFYDSTLTEGTKYQDESKKVIKEMWKNVKVEEDKVGDKEFNFYYFEGFAIFFLDISTVEEIDLTGFEEANTSNATPYLGEIIFKEESAKLHKGKAVKPLLDKLLETVKK